MKKLEYKISINAPAEKVWNTMANHGTYKQWVAASSPNTTYEGRWENDATIKFFVEDQSGTLARITNLERFRRIQSRHEAILLEGGVEDWESDLAKGWIGTLEEYAFIPKDGGTELVVSIQTRP